MAIRFPNIHWSQAATSQVLNIADEYNKIQTACFLTSVLINSVESQEPLHCWVQSSLNDRLKSQRPFNIKYSFLWRLMKDIGSKLEKHDGLFSITLYNHNADVCSLFSIASKLRERSSNKENDDLVKDLLIAAEAYYKKVLNPPDLMQLGYRLKTSGKSEEFGEFQGMLKTNLFRNATETPPDDATKKSFEQVEGIPGNGLMTFYPQKVPKFLTEARQRPGLSLGFQW